MFIFKHHKRLRYPDPEGDGDLSGDRGNDWTPTEDDADALKAAADAKKAEDDAEAAKKVEEDEAAAKKLADESKTGEEKAAEAKKAEEEAEKKKDTRIPASRHKQILDAERAKREAVENELAKYRQGTQVANTNAEITKAEEGLLKLEAEYAKHVVDGNAEKAAAVMKDIRMTERAIIEKTTEMRMTAANARAVETVRYDTTVERIEAEFPALNVDHEDFDKEKAAEVIEMKEAFQAKGYTPSAALQKAVKYIMPPKTVAQTKAVTTEARVDPAEVEKQRKADAVKKALEASGKQPPLTNKVGKDSDTKGGGAVTAADALKMPYKEFAELDEKALSRMRGDDFEGS